MLFCELQKHHPDQNPTIFTLNEFQLDDKAFAGKCHKFPMFFESDLKEVCSHPTFSEN